MARVKVKTFSVIRDVLNSDVVEIEVDDPATVRGLFDVLLCQYGQPFKEKIWDPNTGEITPFLIRLNETIIRSTSDLAEKYTSLRNSEKVSAKLRSR